MKDIEHAANYEFVHADIQDLEKLTAIFSDKKITHVVHLAAESHVDRSITDPLAFVKTNVLGTANLLQVAKEAWKNDFSDRLFYHVSTDEVYGSLGDAGFFYEDTAYDPRSPYSASKAASDHLVRAWGKTYGLPFLISNCSNNYGPYQYPEKLIPVVILACLQERKIPIYGEGKNIRDWLYVSDHVKAILKILDEGVIGETYNIGGGNELTNIELVNMICEIMDKNYPRSNGKYSNLINFVKDRNGHDRRYAVNATKIKSELGWKPSVSIKQGLEITIDWYFKNKKWWMPIQIDNNKFYKKNS